MFFLFSFTFFEVSSGLTSPITVGYYIYILERIRFFGPSTQTKGR